jgi:hypothetical protein
MKKLKYWNGRGVRNGHFYIAAYSQKQAAELLGKVFGFSRGMLPEIRNYFSPCWGNQMKDIKPEVPSIYYSSSSYDDKPKLVLELKSNRYIILLDHTTELMG